MVGFIPYKYPQPFGIVRGPRFSRSLSKDHSEYIYIYMLGELGLGVERTYTSFTSVPYHGSKILLSWESFQFGVDEFEFIT